MTESRRKFIKNFLIGVSSFFVGISSKTQAAWFADLFARKPAEEILEKTLKITEIEESDKVLLDIPKIAENGAVVPIKVQSTLENVQQLIIMAEKNPVPIVAVFELSPDVETFVSLQIKMSESSNVVAILKAGGKFYKAEQLVKVTIGGCGG